MHTVSSLIKFACNLANDDKDSHDDDDNNSQVISLTR